MAEPKAGSISDVLAYYDKELVPVLAAAIVIDDTFPVEVLNEVRSAMTHIARADKLEAEAQRYDLDAAVRHLQRGVLDSAKTGIAGLANRCDVAVDFLQQEYRLPPDLLSEVTEIRRRRLELSVAEAQDAPNHNLVQEYLELFSLFDEFYADLDKKYSLGNLKRRLIGRRISKTLFYIVSLIVAFALGLLVEFSGSKLF